MLAWLFTSLVRDALFFLGYLNDRASFPKPLTAREERAFIRRMQEGDDAARRALIEHNLRLVAHIARKYTVPGCDADDLVSIGAIGLIKAVGTFKPESGTTLSTYASRCIENEILMCLRASHKRRNDVSLEEPVGSDSEGNEVTLMEMLGTDPDAVIDEVDRRVTLARIRQLVRQKLTERERIVLEMRYGLLDGECRPQYEVAEKLGISRSYVSRIEKKAVQTLEKALRGG